MRCALTGLFVACVVVSGCRPTPRSPPQGLTYVGGIQVNEPILDRWIERVGQAGLNTVSVTVYAKHGDWDSGRLWSDAEVPPVRAEIAAAKKAGLRVVLIVRVALEHAIPRNRFLWHGMIAPRTKADLDAWFTAYSAFVRTWAQVAQEERVDVFGIGSELNRMTATRAIDRPPALEEWYLDDDKQADFKRRVLVFDDRLTKAHRASLGGGDYVSNARFLDARQAVWREWANVTTYMGAPAPLKALNQRRSDLDRRWRKLIADIRRVYTGKLTYAANFDHYDQVTFWDALDLIGINAYFELRRDLSTADLNRRLTRSWREVFDRIQTFRAQHHLRIPVLFTELGYTQRRHSTLRPWAQSGFDLVKTATSAQDELLIWEDQPTDLSERTMALRALRRVAVCERPGMLDGVLYWKLSSWPDQRDVEPFVIIMDESDPAEVVLRRFTSSDCAPTDISPSSTAR